MGIGAAIGGIAGGLLSSNAAGDAADAQQQSAQNQLALETRVYDETVERFQPYLNTGYDAQNVLAYELGLTNQSPTFGGEAPEIVEFQDNPANSNPATWNAVAGSEGSRFSRPGLGGQLEYRTGSQPPAAPQPTTRFRVGDQVFDSRDAAQQYADANSTGGSEYQGFQATPGYEFQRDQGLAAIDNSAASRGNVFSGATMKAAQTFGQGLANQEYNNFLNRITGVASGGQAAAGNAANAGANFAAGASNAYGAIGNAQAAGAIGQANALNAGINNAIGGFNYQNQLSGGGGFGGITIGGPGSLFGGSSWS